MAEETWRPMSTCPVPTPESPVALRRFDGSVVGVDREGGTRGDAGRWLSSSASASGAWTNECTGWCPLPWRLASAEPTPPLPPETEAPIPFTLAEPSDPSDLELTSDQANDLEVIYAVAREARFTFGGEAQDLKLIEECCELARALARRLGHQGQRGAVDDELADVLQLVLGAMGPEAEAWKVLREKKLPHVRGLIAVVKNRG